MAIQHVHLMILNGTASIGVVAGDQLCFGSGRVGQLPMPEYHWTTTPVPPDAYGAIDSRSLSISGKSSSELWSPDSLIFAVKSWGVTERYGSIKGRLTINGIGGAREVFAMKATDTHEVLGSTKSAADGTIAISWSKYVGTVLVIMLDDLGAVWQPDSVYAVGDLVRPGVWNGWQYECVNPGSAAIEPNWWAGEGVTALVGTATFKARQYITAQSHGPLTPIIEER